MDMCIYTLLDKKLTSDKAIEVFFSSIALLNDCIKQTKTIIK